MTQDDTSRCLMLYQYTTIAALFSFILILLPPLSAHAAQVTADSMAGYWKFDETSGTSATDSSGEANTATNSGATVSSDVPTTIYTNARSLLFDGVRDTATVASSSSLNIGSNNFTLMAWVKGNNMAGSDIIFGKSNGGGASTSYGFLFGVFGGLNPAVYWATSATALSNVQSNVAISNGAWTHVAIVIDRSDSTKCKVYINGSAVSTTVTNLATNTGNISNSVSLNFGSESDGGFNWDGYIDDSRIYKRALSDREITEIAGGNHPTAYWKGGAGTGFEEKQNWSGSYIPDPYSRIIVQATPMPLTLTGAVKAASLTTNSGALMKLNGTGFTMNDSGIFTNYGTLALKNSETIAGLTVPTDKGTIILTGTGTMTGLKTGNSYHNLTLNDGLTGYWKFDETSGTRAIDSSGYGHSGSILGDATISTNVPLVHFYNARSLHLDGIDDYVFLPDVPSMQPSSLSAGAWFKTSAAGYQRIFRKRWHGYSLDMSDGQVIASVWENNSSSLDVTSPLSYNDNAWHHAFFTYDGTDLLLYIDGKLVAKDHGAGTHNIYYVDGGISIGRDGDNDSGYFTGNIDDVRLYNRALSPIEVSALGIGNQPSTASGTVTLNANLNVRGNLILNGKALDVSSSNYAINLSGSLLTNGGTINARDGTLILSGRSGSNDFLSGGQRFNNITINGNGATWNTRDRLHMSGALTINAGTLDNSGSYVIKAGTWTQNGGVFTPRSGTVILTAANNHTLTPPPNFSTLRVEDPTENGLVGYWKFDEGNGSSIRDASPNENHGTRTGTGLVWTGSTLASAISFHNPYAMKFNGINDMVEVPQSSDFELQELTYSAWMYLSPLAGDRNAIVTYGQGTEIGGTQSTESVSLIYHKTSDLLRFRLKDSLDNSIIDLQSTPTTSLSGRWTHVAVTWNGSTGTIYLNGLAIGSSTNAGTIHYTNDSLSKMRIGNWFGNNERYFNGSLDDIRIYNRALAANEISNLARGRYAAGNSSTATVTLAGDVTTDYLALDSGNLDTSSYDMTVTNTLTMLRGRGNLTTGLGTVSLGGLTLSGAKVIGGSNRIDINGDLSILTGSLITPDLLNISGDFTKTGGYFVANAGTVTLDGANQSIAGSMTFDNFTKNVSSPDTLTLGAGDTLIVEGALSLQGVRSNFLTLQSSIPGTQWIMNPSGTKTIAYVNVRDSNNAGVVVVDCVNFDCINSGNNTNWTFTNPSTSAQSITDNGGRRGEGSNIEATLRAKAAIEEQYRRAIVRQPDEELPITLKPADKQPTDALPSNIGTYGIERQRNRLILASGDVRILYKDVVADAWYAPYVAKVIQEDIARGYKDNNGKLTGEFGVVNPVTYAEMVKMTLEAAGKSDIKTAPPRNASARETWASAFIAIAESLNLSVITPEKNVYTPITRGEVIQLILESMNITIGKTASTFFDVPANHPHTYAIAAAAFFGLIEGDTNELGNPLNTFRPDAYINRAEAAKLVALALELQKTGSIAPAGFGGMEETLPSSSPLPSSASSTSSSSLAPTPAARVTSDRLNVRLDARADSLLLQTLKKDETVIVLWKQTNGWSRVRTSNGTEGYALAQFLEETR